MLINNYNLNHKISFHIEFCYTCYMQLILILK